MRATTLSALSLLFPLPLWLFLPLIAVAMMQFGLISSNFNAIVMEPLGQFAGAGAAIQGFVQTFGGALVGALIGRAFNGSTSPMALGFLAIGAMSLTLVWWAEGGRLFVETN